MIYQFEFAESSVLRSVEYNNENEEMTIQFLNGRSYTYTEVPKSTYDALINAGSAGKYFASIKKDLKLK